MMFWTVCAIILTVCAVLNIVDMALKLWRKRLAAQVLKARTQALAQHLSGEVEVEVVDFIGAMVLPKDRLWRPYTAIEVTLGKDGLPRPSVDVDIEDLMPRLRERVDEELVREVIDRINGTVKAAWSDPHKMTVGVVLALKSIPQKPESVGRRRLVLTRVTKALCPHRAGVVVLTGIVNPEPISVEEMLEETRTFGPRTCARIEGIYEQRFRVEVTVAELKARSPRELANLVESVVRSFEDQSGGRIVNQEDARRHIAYNLTIPGWAN